MTELSPPKKPKILGILNLTPDSFSDGGQFTDPLKAVDQVFALAADGADAVDVGCESTRPGAEPVALDEELTRLESFFNALAKTSAKKPDISVDSRKEEVLLAGLEFGCRWLNDTGGVSVGAHALANIAATGANYIAMHGCRDPKTMQQNPLSADAALTSVKDFFAASAKTLLAAGFAPEKIWLDPGIGFGKTVSANLQLLALKSNYQLAIGVSRKSFIDKIFAVPETKDRDPLSKAFEFAAIAAGAALIRTHDVKGLVNLLRHGGLVH
jgi:dihydropteroate synthase